MGFRAVPVIRVGDETMLGFSAVKLRRMLGSLDLLAIDLWLAQASARGEFLAYASGNLRCQAGAPRSRELLDVIGREPICRDVSGQQCDEARFLDARASHGKVSWNSVGGGTMNRLKARSEIALRR